MKLRRTNFASPLSRRCPPDLDLPSPVRSLIAGPARCDLSFQVKRRCSRLIQSAPRDYLPDRFLRVFRAADHNENKYGKQTDRELELVHGRQSIARHYSQQLRRTCNVCTERGPLLQREQRVYVRVDGHSLRPKLCRRRRRHRGPGAARCPHHRLRHDDGLCHVHRGVKKLSE